MASSGRDEIRNDTALRLEPAGPAGAGDVVVLRTAVAMALTRDFGPGHWSSVASERGVLWDMRRARVYVLREDGRSVATLSLQTRKPWAIDTRFFPAAQRPLYLGSLAVAPERQRSGLGRICIAEAVRLARELPADALRLDAYDAPAGAGGFYRKCGFEDRGRAVYRGVPLLYFEMRLS